MSNNIAVTEGSGKTVATEDIGGVQYQKVIIAGSVATVGTAAANQSVSGTVQVDVRSSVAVVIIGGSILTSSTANQSVSGTIGASIIGLPPFRIGDSSNASVITVGTAVANQSVSGTVNIGTIPGSVVAFQGTVPWIIGSVYGNISGSVAAFVVGSSSIITRFADSSLLSVPVGSVITLNQGSSILAVPVGSVITVLQAPSIVGTYAEDAAHTSADKGVFVLTVRNETMSSITSADGDYSPISVGPLGEAIVANSPLTKWVSGTASMLGGTPVTGSLVPIIAAQGASIFTYITAVQIANGSANNAWITLLGGTNSVIGYTVAPANGGSNIVLPNALKTNANAAFSASISAVASVYVSAQGFISKI